MDAAPGTGADSSLDLRVELHAGLYAPGIVGLELTTGHVDMTERLDPRVPPHGGARDATMEIGNNLGGYSYGLVSQLAGEGAGSWAYNLEAGPHEISDEGITTWAHGFGWLGTTVAFGAAAEGAGSLELSFDLAAVYDNKIFLSAGVGITYNQPLSTSIGASDAGQTESYDGLLFALETNQIGPSPVHLAGMDAILEAARAGASPSRHASTGRTATFVESARTLRRPSKHSTLF